MTEFSTFIGNIPEPRKAQLQQLHNFILKTTPELKPFVYSDKYFGYGKFHYKYESGREGDWFLVGLGNNKNYISLYVCAFDQGKAVPELYKDQLPKANIGKSCIRFKKIEDLDMSVVAAILQHAVRI